LEFLEQGSHVLDLFPHHFAHIDRCLLQRCHRHAIARACVEFHDLALLEFVLGGDDQPAVENTAFEIIDDDPLDLAAERGEDIREQVVGEGPLLLRIVQVEPDGVADRLVDIDGENLLVILETRLDNVVFRAGFAKSRDMARQLVRHGHFLVNGKKVNIPSYRVSAMDIIDVLPKSHDLTPFIVASAEFGEKSVPAWMEVVASQMRIIIHGVPARSVIDTQVQEQLIVELYSK